jgi:predicted porin
MMKQKKILALALSAGLAAPLVAFADNANFTFYGAIDVSYDSINTGDGSSAIGGGGTPVTGTSKRVVSSNVSKFGFKGAEDLGNGLSGIWQIEQQINVDDAVKTTFASRNTYGGLKSDSIGTLLFGINDTPYKTAVRKLDLFGDNIGDNRALLGAPKAAAAAAVSATAGNPAFAGASNLGFELRPTNILQYTSPAFAGVTVAVASANLTEQNYVSTDKSNSLMSVAAIYDVAPFYGSAAYETHKLETVAPGGKESATRLGFGFKPEAFELNAVYEKTTDNLGANQVNKQGHSAYYVGAKYNFSNDAVKLAYGNAGDQGLSKNSKVYALYSRISNGKGINYGFSQSSAAAASASGGYGSSPTVLSLGYKHSF